MPGVIRVAAVVITLSATMCPSARAAEPAPTLVIRVLDLAHTRSGILIEAQHHVTRVYGVAGINVVWREGEDDAPDARVQVTVLILSDAMTQDKTSKERISSGVLGTAAPPPAHRAWVFLRRIEDAASRQGQSPGLILGHVIAHEVAHMLANVEHSVVGVMAATLQLRPDILQAFTAEESQQLRTAIRAESGPVVLDARDRSRPFWPRNK
jgi:hypothetical protein